MGQRVLRNLVFHYAISVPFYLSCGLDLDEVFLVEGVYWVARSLVDVPLGRLADRFGHKPALLSGTALTALAYLALGHGGTFGWFVGTSVGLALGHALCIGTDSALARAALERLGRWADYPRTESLGWLGRNAALAVSMALGGVVATRLAYRTAIALSAGLVAPALLFVLALPGAPACDRGAPERSADGLRPLRHHALDVAARLVVYAVFVVNEFTGNLLVQLILERHAFPVDRIALAFASVLVVAAVSSLLVPGLAQRPPGPCLALLTGLVTTHFALQGLGLLKGGEPGVALSLLGFAFYGIARGTYHPIFRTWIGNGVAPEGRAAVFAAASTVGTLAVGATNLGFAWALERAGLVALTLGCALAVPITTTVAVMAARRLCPDWSIARVGGYRDPRAERATG